jgi:hypothetical protein
MQLFLKVRYAILFSRTGASFCVTFNVSLLAGSFFTDDFIKKWLTCGHLWKPLYAVTGKMTVVKRDDLYSIQNIQKINTIKLKDC